MTAPNTTPGPFKLSRDWPAINAKSVSEQASAAHIRFMLEDAQKDIAALLAEMDWVIDTLQEINPSNYGHDDVCALNGASVEVILGLQDIVRRARGEAQ